VGILEFGLEFWECPPPIRPLEKYLEDELTKEKK
jgi:hypothetical protein